jgi:hypothetical protein
MRQRCASAPWMRQRHALGLGLRTAGGGCGAAVSRVTAKRQRV